MYKYLIILLMLISFVSFSKERDLFEVIEADNNVKIESEEGSETSKKKVKKEKKEKAKKKEKKFDKKMTCSYVPTQSMTFEAGLQVGTPAGIDAKFWFTDNIGIFSSLGFDYDKNIAFDIGALFQFITIYKSNSINLMLDFGISTSMGTTKDDNGDRVFKTGIYIPIGLALPFKKEPITFSAYFAPGTSIKPEAAWDYRWGLVFNYSFGKAAKINKYRKCLSYKVKGLGNLVAALEGQNSKLSGQNSMLEGRNTELKAENVNLNQKIGSLESDKNKLESDLSNLKTEKKDLENNLNNIETEKKKLEEKYQNATLTEQKELKEQIEKLKKQKEEAEEAKNRLEEEKKELDKKREKANAELVKYNKKRCIASGGTFTNKCICPAGRVSRASECVCDGINEVWSSKKNKCLCKRGHSKKNGVCTKCNLVSYWGSCVNSCRSPEVSWKGQCVCPNSKNFKRARNGKCVCKKGYKEYVSGRCDPIGN